MRRGWMEGRKDSVIEGGLRSGHSFRFFIFPVLNISSRIHSECFSLPSFYSFSIPISCYFLALSNRKREK